MHQYGRDLRDHTEYWIEQYRLSQATASAGLERLSSVFVVYFDSWATDWRRATRSANTPPLVAEQARQTGLATLASSMLIRRILGESGAVQDGIGVGAAELMVDLEDDDLPLRYRVHAPRTAAIEPADEWHHDGDLYVQTVRPAEPSGLVGTYVAEHGIEVDLSQFETHYAFLRSRV